MKKMLKITLDDLALLCLNVDYVLPSHLKDKVEDLSISLQHKYGFDTYRWRITNKIDLRELDEVCK